ncbi:MAG: OsmC family protein [Gemmatimonadota bacterium]|nr:OsmC family protein [Gemmatimonadota bacterium]
MKITIISDRAIRLEAHDGPLTIEADTAELSYGPFHMLGSSLAYCTYSVQQSWATHAGIDADSLLVDVAWKFAENPHRVGEISVSLTWPGLPAERVNATKRVAALCAVHKTLTHPAAIGIEVKQ